MKAPNLAFLVPPATSVILLVAPRLVFASPPSFDAAANYNVGPYPTALCTQDFDGDGDIDVATANSYGNSVSILFNDGSGLLGVRADYAATLRPSSVIAADLDGDGDADLTVTNLGFSSFGRTVSVYINNGHGTFQPKVDYDISGSDPTSVCAADFDRDGDVDLAVAHYFAYVVWSYAVAILLNNGDGTFASAIDYDSPAYGGFLTACDVDRDGDADVVAAASGSVAVHRNNGDGTFAFYESYAANGPTSAVWAGDLDQDGYPDLVTANQSDLSVFWNSGNGTFENRVERSVGWQPTFVTAENFDCGLMPDLAVCGSDQKVAVLMNGGGRVFEDGTDYGTGIGPVAVAVADLDSDGNWDLVSANGGSNSVSVLRNLASNAGHQFAIVSATTSASLYQNGHDTVQFYIETRNDGNRCNEFHLSLDLEPSFGPTMHAGDDYFTMPAGDQHVSHISWTVPDRSYVWEFAGHLTFTDGLMATERRLPGWFSGTPLPLPAVAQYEQQVEGCLNLDPTVECNIRLLSLVPRFGTLVTLGLAANEICKMNKLLERGETGAAAGAFWAITPGLGKQLVLETLQWVPVVGDVMGAVKLFHTGSSLARECWREYAAEILRLLPGMRATSGDALVSSTPWVVDSLAAWTMRGIDSTDVQLANGLFVGGNCRVRVEADGSWTDKDSLGLVFATVENVDTLGLVALTTPHMHRLHGSETDNPNSESTFRIESKSNQSVSVSLVHSRQDGGRDFLRYAALTATSRTCVTLPVDVGEKKFPMFVDLNGDGMNDQIHYPGGAVVGVRDDRGPRIGLQLWPGRPNPFNGTTTLAFSLPDAGHARLDVYDVAGRLVARLVDRWVTGNETHVVTWDGRSVTGGRVASGVYFCRLSTDQRIITQRLVILR